MIHDTLPAACGGVVRLINDDQIGGGADLLQAAYERLDRCNLNGVVGGLSAGGNDAVLNTGQGELLGGLRDQLTAMDQHDGGPAPIGHAAQNLSHDDCLAATGREHQQGSACAIAESEAQV